MSATAALAIVMASWLAIGVVTGATMGRRGHDGFTWMLLGATLGPLVVPLALSTQHRSGPTRRPTVREGPRASRRAPRRRQRALRAVAAWLTPWTSRAGLGQLSLVAGALVAG
jgi:hypothetical protein